MHRFRASVSQTPKGRMESDDVAGHGPLGRPTPTPLSRHKGKRHTDRGEEKSVEKVAIVNFQCFVIFLVIFLQFLSFL